MDLPLAFIFSRADRIKKHIYYTWWVLTDFAFSCEYSWNTDNLQKTLTIFQFILVYSYLKKKKKMPKSISQMYSLVKALHKILRRIS